MTMTLGRNTILPLAAPAPPALVFLCLLLVVVRGGASSSSSDGGRGGRGGHGHGHDNAPLVLVHRPDPSRWSRTKCGAPAGDADIPSRWASEVNPSVREVPLEMYPRPQMVRCDVSTTPGGRRSPCVGGGGGGAGGGEEGEGIVADGEADRLRDEGDGPSTWQNLNGLWEWEAAKDDGTPFEPLFGRTLEGTILVPFPVESCLSGVPPPRKSADAVRNMWYRLTFDYSPGGAGAGTRGESRKTTTFLLHFGAVDWSTRVYLNGRLLGNHTGGYDGFTFDVTSDLIKLLDDGDGDGDDDEDGSSSSSGGGGSSNELLVYVSDPSDAGAQPNGKQRLSAIDECGGDTYTPSSGIWQTVWLESVSHPGGIGEGGGGDAGNVYIEDVTIDQASTERVGVTVEVAGPSSKKKKAAAAAEELVEGGDGGGLTARVEVLDGPDVVAAAAGSPGRLIDVPVPNAKLWSPSRPFLYDLRVTLLIDTLRDDKTQTRLGKGMEKDDSSPAVVLDAVLSYFGLRTFTASPASSTDATLRPTLNGHSVFLAGVLDQSFWPDGLYTAPTDDALAFDVALIPDLGMNLIRLHQKINPERWYYHADRAGVVVFQDLVQKYKGATNATVPLFVRDMKAAIRGPRGNHPCIVQWTVFNEADCWNVFTEKPYDIPGMVDLARRLDPTHRLIDTDSGGGANDLHAGDVNDYHSYPFPNLPRPSTTQYSMVGEYGGLGIIPSPKGTEWMPGGCYAYERTKSSQEYAALYAGMASLLEVRRDMAGLGAAVYTQTTDVECECDGLVNYDRSAKFRWDEVEMIKRANRRLTASWDYGDGEKNSGKDDASSVKESIN